MTVTEGLLIESHVLDLAWDLIPWNTGNTPKRLFSASLLVNAVLMTVRYTPQQNVLLIGTKRLTGEKAARGHHPAIKKGSFTAREIVSLRVALRALEGTD
jgi:hypothetical protein